MYYSRGDYRFKQKEIWNLSDTLAKVIHDGLVQFKKLNRYGAPTEFKSIEEWNQVLDQMIYSFNELSTEKKNSPLEQYFQDRMYQTDPMEFIEDLSEGKNPIDIPDVVMEEELKYKQKLDKGLELFAKYFEDLWD